MKRVFLTAALFLSLAGPALAGPTSAPASQKAPPVQKIDMGEADSVTGTRSGPLIDPVTGKKRRKPSKLIKIREDFINEIVNSAQGL